MERARAAAEATDVLRQASEVRDLLGARAAHRDAEGAWGVTLRTVVRRPDPAGKAIVVEVRTIQQKLERVERLLDRLEEAAGSVDPALQERVDAMRNQQQQLHESLEQAQERGQKVVREFPVRPEGLQEAMEEAGERMGQASDDLSEGRPMQAEGSQGVAAERIGSARDSLQRAMDQAQRQRQESGSEGQSGARSGSGDSEGDGSEMDLRGVIEIPGREEFTTPEAYRRALLEGMEGAVPEEYRALKKRYYEELVHQ